ncbi:T9SS type A sorting domain-containing protein [Rurimicrobium arvi]
MKPSILVSALLATFSAQAQTSVSDTVILGSGYANQVWYRLPADEAGTQPKNNWDLAFRISGSMSSDIMVNNSGSGALWVYPKSGTSGWSSVDTTGLSTWSGLYNNETSWLGAMGRYTDASNPYDLGWGIYDMGTHNVVGDSIYIIKTQAGNFKKLIIEKLASSTYTFTYANLNGSDETTSIIAKSSYTGKKYGYFSLDTKTALDREPLNTDWDLVFGQYATGDYSSMGIAGYTVTGVLANDTLKIAKAVVDPATRSSYTAFSSLTFSGNINGLGYNWKSTSGVVKDSNVYFIRRNNGDIWKLYFTGWISGVSGNGSIIFTKERLSGTSISEQVKSNTALALSPNPSQSGQMVQVVYHFETGVDNAQLLISDITGRIVHQTPLEKTAGLHVYGCNAPLSAGTYFVQIHTGSEKSVQKLVIQ